MKFAMFYEIPVARPWSRHSEHEAYQEVVEQVRLGDKVGFHSVWTVEHHFLEEFSHCSNPEVLYGHLAAVTESLRLGYGVRLMPKPYNHRVRTPPEELARRIAIYRDGIDACTDPIGRFVNDQAATFTMVNVAPTSAEAVEVAAEGA